MSADLNIGHSMIDWDALSREIPGCNDLEGPLGIIQSCLTTDTGLDPYDQIERQLTALIADLQQSFNELECG